MDVVIDTSTGIPSIIHWGATLGPNVTSEDLESIVDDVRVPASLDASTAIPVVPMHADGFLGRPGLQGHRRGGRHWSPRFSHVDSRRRDNADGSQLVSRSADPIAELEIETTFSLDSFGTLSIVAAVDNVGDSPLMIDALTVSIPFPRTVEELGVLSGRWVREFRFERFAWMTGAWTVENRSGRTSHEHPPFIWMFERGTTDSNGQVWGLHTAWSGNHVTYAEKFGDGRRYVQSGELFHPGEMCIYPGQRLSTPTIVGVHSMVGISGASQSFHDYVRHISPKRTRPRPVHLNTWEAVYFDHDIDRLTKLADVAARVGVERFVLDDGWFASRRSDESGLGDWYVSSDIYPDGLHPLIDHVNALGMEFGIWVEPEMANLNSEIVRNHPDWILATSGYEPILGRHQVVLDLGRQDVADHLFERLDALLGDNAISYVKWDMNRPLVHASDSLGKATSHQYTLAVYQLLDRLRERHPHVEFESCASGGGRIDYEMLRRVERVWTSDSNDALERQLILQGASMVLPLEVLGSHIGPSPAHTTRRRHAMSFRGATALFGHMGIEADLTRLDDRDIADVSHVIEVYKRFRSLIHSGDVVRFDSIGDERESGSPAALVHGVQSKDRRQALVSIVQLTTESALAPGHVRIPGLLVDERYHVEFVPMSSGQASGNQLGPASEQPAWLAESLAGHHVPVLGRVLAEIGLQRPVMWPESAIVVHLRCA